MLGSEKELSSSPRGELKARPQCSKLSALPLGYPGEAKNAQYLKNDKNSPPNLFTLADVDEKAAAGVFLTETKSAIHTLLEVMNERQADRQIKRVLFCVYV